MSRAWLVLVALAVAFTALPTAEAKIDVQIQNGAFSPDSIRAQPGEGIVFTNLDGTAHTITSSWDGGASISREVGPGQSVVLVFEEAGSYRVHSAQHPGMQATIEVASPEPPQTRSLVLPLLLGSLTVMAVTVFAFFAMRRRLPRSQS